MIEDRFLTRENGNALWSFLDYVFDDGAKCDGILGGLEEVFETVEDFCAAQGIHDVPPLYKYVFKVRGGFLTQSKAPWYMRADWNAKFPERIVPGSSSDILVAYRDFLKPEKKIAKDYIESYLKGIILD